MGFYAFFSYSTVKKHLCIQRAMITQYKKVFLTQPSNEYATMHLRIFKVFLVSMLALYPP